MFALSVICIKGIRLKQKFKFLLKSYYFANQIKTDDFKNNEKSTSQSSL